MKDNNPNRTFKKDDEETPEEFLGRATKYFSYAIGNTTITSERAQEVYDKYTKALNGKSKDKVWSRRLSSWEDEDLNDRKVVCDSITHNEDEHER